MNKRPVVFVTGASSGIGEATALKFARRGYDVAMADQSLEQLERMKIEVRSRGASALLFPGDLVDLDYAKSAVAETIKRWGPIDVLVNNAAWREIVTMRTIDIESWEKTLRVCLTAPAFLARWVAEHMERQRYGVIINISSIQSQTAAGISPAYVACKGALDSLTYELAALWGPKGIRVVALNPGTVDTASGTDYQTDEGESLTTKLHEWSEDMIPMRRWATPEEIARTIFMLASNDASYISGTTVVVDGGFKTQHFPYSLKHQMFPKEF